VRFFKPFIAALGAVLVLDTIWWFVNLHFVPAYWPSVELMTGRWTWILFMFYDPTVAIPWLAIGLLVAVIGWIRVRSLAPGLMVASGAFVGTLAPFALLTFKMFTSCCEGN
jgi:hypothetical protein